MTLRFQNPVVVHALGATFVAGLLVSFYALVLAPVWHERGDRVRLENKLADHRMEFDRSQRARRALAAQLTKTIEAAENVELRLKPSVEVNKQVAALADLAARCGMEIDSIQPGPATANPRFQAISLQINGRSPYRSVHTFFQALRKNLPDTSVTDFSLTADPSSRPVTAAVRMNLVWLACPTPNPAAPAKK